MSTSASNGFEEELGKMAQENPPLGVDTGLLCLSALCRFHQLALDTAQLAREYYHGMPLTDADLLRAGKQLGFRCRLLKCEQKADERSLPAMVRYRNGQYGVLARIINGQYLVHDLREPSPVLLSAEEYAEQCTGEVLLFVRKLNLEQRLRSQFDIRWFIPALLKYKRLFGEVLVASFFLQVLALVTPLFFQVVMDKVVVHQSFSTLHVLAVGFFAVILFEALLGGVRTYLFAHTTHRVDVELGAALYRHLLALPLAWFQSRSVGQSVARVHELDTIRQFITGSALTLLIDLFFTFLFLAIMLYYSATLTLIVLATLPCYALLTWLAVPILRERLNEKFRHGAQNQSFLVESVSGIETAKSLALEPQMQKRWEEQLAQYVRSSFRAQHCNNVVGELSGLINKLMVLGIITWGAHLVMRGDISVGQLVAFNMFAGRIAGPILKLMQLGQDFQQAKISVARLGDILNTPPEPGFNPNRTALPNLQGFVDFQQVRFRYQLNGSLVLDEVSLRVRPGEVVGVIGQSGSGKSTLVKLIQRLYVPEAGRVLVDGVDLASVDSAWLRSHIGVVLQESFLFRRSVRDNIAFANPGASMQAVVQAAKLAGAHEFISGLPDAYDTLVEEHGANLSGGQRQRIAIARALLNNPRILIFDEATSALDYESERRIQDNMAAICHDRTVFIIAHRLSTVRDCDRIIVMDKGRIIEQGAHEQLLAKGGYYARLHRYQSEKTNFREVVQ